MPSALHILCNALICLFILKTEFFKNSNIKSHAGRHLHNKFKNTKWRNLTFLSTRVAKCSH